MYILLMGPPGAGKGTQASNLVDKYDLVHISTGDIFRKNIKEQTELGKKVKQYLDKGQLVPVELVTRIIKNRLSKDDCKNGYILDGFPRSVEQAGELEKMNAEIDNGEDTKFIAVYFDIDTSILVERIVNRRSCPVCGEIYNLEFKPPKTAGHCDKDGAELTQRKDDTREVAQSRFDTYNKETAPLVDYYTKKGVLKSIDANGTIDEVWERLLEVIK